MTEQLVFRRPDNEIRAEIEHEVFERHLMTPLHSVHVSVDRGVVLLTGRVPWRSDIDAALVMIAEVAGVVDIKDRLVCVYDDQRRRLY